MLILDWKEESADWHLSDGKDAADCAEQSPRVARAARHDPWVFQGAKCVNEADYRDSQRTGEGRGACCARQYKRYQQVQFCRPDVQIRKKQGWRLC